jgi:hypothetical protein
MKKRSAEKVIARSILALATYRKTTMARALRKRPRFWTVPRPARQSKEEPPRKRLRLKFGVSGGFAVDTSAMASMPPPLPAAARLR